VHGPILALETSCDETAAAVVQGTRVRSNVVASQAEMHRKWGGVVPEAAARAHVESILPVIDEALSQAQCTLEEIESIAVTNRPGLVGALSIGVSAARALGLALGVPVMGIHHLEGHLMSTRAADADLPQPALALIVSGGHTELIEIHDLGDYRLIGETRDDAAGEAFDKGARLLGLGYPGGQAVERAAATGNPNRYPLPRALRGDAPEWSFSGLKTAVRRLVETEGANLNVADAAASLQEAIVEVLAVRTLVALEERGHRALALVGGVAANQALRERLARECTRRGVRFAVPARELCTDNAAMIGLAAAARRERGEGGAPDLEAKATEELTANPYAAPAR
jgi:N6-L-threonylcarbamoyladenine synthase